jgi:hypothetical protein
VKLNLSFYEEAGTDRGGCDVALRAELVSDEDPGTGDQAAEKAGRAFDGWLAAAPTKSVDDSDFDEEVYVEEGRVKTCKDPSDYGFFVDQPVEKVRDYVCWLARTGVGHGSPEWDPQRGRREGEWLHSLRTKLYTLTADLFRDGNAD